VGCGSGIEAAVLGLMLRAEVTGIDVATNFDERAAQVANLKYGDATNMDFEDGTFDFVFSFHALEHIPEYQKALLEMRRVLRPGGGWLIGTPNRDRLIGYLGSKDASLRQKIEWNMVDWKAKLQGRFRNEMGAHAGYTTQELANELSSVFSAVHDITNNYYRVIYRRKKNLIEAILSLGMGRWLLPAVYFMGTR
jgi:ubiquinone/menaquinone biosynthesis C-methylase UbiE